MGDQAEQLRELARRIHPVSKVTPARPRGSRALGRTIVVTSGKGGVGKTNVTVNLALALARRKRSTILFDADMGMANVDVLMGISPPATIVDVIRGRRSLRETVVPYGDHLGIVPGGSGIPELANLETDRIATVIEQLHELEQDAEFILVDTGAGIGRTVTNFVMAADEIIVVTTPEPTAFTDAYGMIKEIDAHNPDARVSLLVNMVDSEQEARAVAAKLTTVVERFLRVRVQYLSCIERDQVVVRSVLQQRPFVSHYPGAVATRRLNLLAGALLTQGQLTGGQGGGFFQRLVDRVRQVSTS